MEEGVLISNSKWLCAIAHDTLVHSLWLCAIVREILAHALPPTYSVISSSAVLAISTRLRMFLSCISVVAVLLDGVRDLERELIDLELDTRESRCRGFLDLGSQ